MWKCFPLVNSHVKRIWTLRPSFFNHHSSTLLKAKSVIFKIHAIDSLFTDFGSNFPTAIKIVKVALKRREDSSQVFVDDLVLGVVDGVGALGGIFVD